MRNVIIYGSQYGTAKRYAGALAQRTGFDLKCCDEPMALDSYDVIVYIGALYAGGVLGLKKTFSGMRDCGDKRIVIATVGLADPEDGGNIEAILKGLKRQLPEPVFQHARFCHLRGGIDYSRLSLKHRAMMALLYRKANGLPEAERTAEVRAMIDTYGKHVDFVDFSRLDRIISEIGRGERMTEEDER